MNFKENQSFFTFSVILLQWIIFKKIFHRILQGARSQNVISVRSIYKVFELKICQIKICKFIWNEYLTVYPWIWLKVPFHRGFLGHWNSQKSVCNVWQRFSCLLDEGIPKICKKLNSHDGFLSYLQNSTANSAHLEAHFCPALVCPQKATVRIQFLPYFWNPLIK